MAIDNWNKHNIQKDEFAVENNIQKTDYKIIIDQPASDVPDFKRYSKRLSQIIANSKPQFTVGIFGGWGTGKTTMMKMIEDEIRKNYSDVATTIWFDSWRYEREEYSLMIPLLRTIILTLHSIIVRLTDDKKKELLTKAQKGFVKMMKAVARGMNINLGGEVGTVGGKVSAGLSLDFAKILDEYSSEGDTFYDQKKIFFHKHVSDYLAEELTKINEKHRLVIFIDDLDRCTPEGALEILESIKTFFDIEGLVYVIGMDPSTIDPIVDVKYGKNPKITGLDYLQKIVQLPVQIPVWSEEDLGRTIKEIANETELPRDIIDKLSEQKMKDLIIKSAKLNPRNIKRFINSLVLSYNTSDENFQNINYEKLKNYIIENYLESMISIQTFYFRGEKWLQFLKMITDYFERIDFLEHFITFVTSKKISYQDLRDKIKDFPSDKYYKPTKKTLEIYNKIIEIKDEDLFTFLQEASVPLLRMDKIENYLRAVDTKKDIEISKSIEIKSYESLTKLEEGIEGFNENFEGSVIHLPYLALIQIFKNPYIDLSKADLFQANLFGADLRGANLSYANLSYANLSYANLSYANLTRPDLNAANLSEADLTGANLSRADLSSAKLTNAGLAHTKLTRADLFLANLTEANLTEANLSRADLRMAKLTKANLQAADLPGANLSSGDLTEANLKEANLTGANLSRTDLPGANFDESNGSSSILIQSRGYESLVLDEKTNFENAICDKSEFIYHVSRFTEAIPTIVKNKRELSLKLKENSFLSESTTEDILETSNLPEEN